MPTPCWFKHLCSIRALVPVFFSLSLSLFFRLISWSTESLWVHFPARASKTLSRRCSAPSSHREGAWGLREQSKPLAGALLAFWVNQGMSASFSPLLSYRRLRITRFWSIKGPQHLSVFNLQKEGWTNEVILLKHLSGRLTDRTTLNKHSLQWLSIKRSL